MTLENEDRDRGHGQPEKDEYTFQYVGLPAQSSEDSEETLADELEERVGQALEGDVASAEDVKDAFRS